MHAHEQVLTHTHTHREGQLICDKVCPSAKQAVQCRSAVIRPEPSLVAHIAVSD